MPMVIGFFNMNQSASGSWLISSREPQVRRLLPESRSALIASSICQPYFFPIFSAEDRRQRSLVLGDLQPLATRVLFHCSRRRPSPE